MFNIERWQEIFQAIKKNKLRTILTGISVSSGIYILVILLGVSKGIQNGVDGVFAGDNINGFSVSPGKTSSSSKGFNSGRRIKYVQQDYDLVYSAIEPFIEKHSPAISKDMSISYKNKKMSYPVVGVYQDYFFFQNYTLSQGRFINEKDNQEKAKVVIVGNSIITILFENHEETIGQNILINGISFKIIGIFVNENEASEEEVLYIPFTVGESIMGEKANKVDEMHFMLKSKEDPKTYVDIALRVFEKIKEILKRKYKIDENDKRAIRISEDISSSEEIYTMLWVLKVFFWTVGICTIVAGVVGVTNIMFIIVRERTKEIGIRKALGAKPFNIIFMILHESIFITLLSGFVGLIMGLITWELAGPFIDTEFFRNPSIDFNTAISAVSILVIAGTLAGFVPAYKATKIKPIEALRTE